MKDTLTGLPSMEGFQELANLQVDAIRKQGSRPVVVAFDLMGMKTFNARYGRGRGDALLRAFADVLRAHFGDEGCSRFAEDHFYAIAKEEGISETIQAVFDSFCETGYESYTPVRAGVYPCNPEDDVAVSGFDRAKVACDLDRRTWASHIGWFTDEMRGELHLRLHVLENLERAISEGWIQPGYQAIIRSATGHVCAEEALARWMDPEFGELLPAQFIPVLEEADLSYKLDLHMVDCVVADLVEKGKRGIPLVPVSVNISLRDLVRINVASEIARRTDRVHLSHDLIKVEFTESASLSDPRLFHTQMDQLHEEGFEVWMDDFGSGYSSLTVLQELDFDLVKLDMGLIHGGSSEKSRIVLSGLVQSLAKMGVGTLAEGVETVEQALFLERVGCDMMQGYHYAQPRSLDDILRLAGHDEELLREDLDEARYWSSVSLLNLDDLSANEGGVRVNGVLVSELPAGVVERRDGAWHIVRANDPYRSFLDRSGILPLERSALRSNPIEGRIDDEFDLAVERSLVSASWELVGGRLEYGSGFQFYVKPVVSSADAEAFMVVAVPTMLGTALGTYGDVPVAYAVFRVIMDEADAEVVDAEYVYANGMYCSLVGIDQHEIIGRPLLSAHHETSSFWLPSCYRAAKLGEHIHDVVYSSELGHWLSFYLTPSLLPGYVVYAFAIVDDEQRELEEILVSRDTSELIIEMVDGLSGEVSYDTAMENLLEMMSRILRPGRLYVFERGEGSDGHVFEWAPPGATTMEDTFQDVSQRQLDAWDKRLENDDMILIPDISVLRHEDPFLFEQLASSGVTRTLAVPLYSDGELVGYFGADNFTMEGNLDYRRLLMTTASFLGARIANRRLLSDLESVGMHDNLTGLLNRRGVDLVVAARLKENAGKPFAVALMDVDDFKTINDMYGHDVGDEVLRTLSRAIPMSFPAGAVVGRNGGDEFLVMLTGDAALRMDELMSSFSRSDLGCEWRGIRYRFTMSMGYAVVPDDAPNLQSAYGKADAALYTVKLEGKDGFRRYTPEMGVQYRSQLGFTPRDIAENIPGGVLVHNPGDDEILFANSELVNMLECDDLADFMKLTGGTFGGLIHPDDRARVREELIQRVGLDETDCRNFADYRIVTKSGAVKHVADSGRLVEVKDFGSLCYELLMDIGERSGWR